MRTPLALLLALAVAGCDVAGTDPPAGPTPDPTPIELSPLAEDLVGQSNGFGLDLFAEVVAADDENLMLSPLSASVALTMLLNGSDGETYAQIHEMLGYEPVQDLDAVNAAYESLREQLLAADPEVQFALANAVFYRDSFGGGIKAPFLGAMRGPFAATVEGLDFGAPSALDVINGWASDNTNGKVPKVLSELSDDLVMLLMNALYFKGEWTDRFDEANTEPGDFHLADGTTVRVPMMAGDVQARFAGGAGYRAVELPYGRRNFSFVALVPDEVPLADFAADLQGGLWAEVTAQLDAGEGWKERPVRLPLFKFETTKKLNKPLQALGMRDAFSGRLADLSRISDAGLFVSFVKQDTFVEVNEEGTEAAAVTTIGIEVTSAPAEFVVDRPFVFAIRERTTNTLLFIGQVADPSS